MATNMRKMELLGMVSQGILLQKFSLATVVILLVLAAATARQQSNWTQRCGDVDVPFPFGMDDKTYLDDTFLITCNTTSFNPPKAFLGDSNIEVTNISLYEGELSVSYIFLKGKLVGNFGGKLKTPNKNTSVGPVYFVLVGGGRK